MMDFDKKDEPSEPKTPRMVHFRSAAKVLATIYLVVMIPTLIWRASWLVPLALNGEHVMGVQAETYRSDHCTCKYTFRVGEKEYTGTGNSCCDIEAGKPIDVYYRTNNPDKSYNMEPSRRLVADLLDTLFGLIIWPGIGGLMYSVKASILERRKA